MSAPIGTIWGEVVTGSGGGNYRKGKIGIYTSISSTSTVTNVTVQVWFWSIYSCSDGSNNIYFNIGADATSATTRVGSASISHKVDSDEWSTSNQTKIYSKTYAYTRRSNNQTCKIYAKFNGVDIISGGTMYASTSVTIPKLATYTVSYNANGGSGAPSSPQTKIYGQTLTLSNTKPTKDGHTFRGWTNEPSSTEVIWTAGGPYTINASRTLYAVWQAKVYTVSYNANGGSGAPSSQTKTYGQTLTLSNTKPTKTNYNFVGWSTSSTATTAEYSAGGSYTDNVPVTLYAVWSLAYSKPRISNFSVRRVNTNGQYDDYGTRCKVIFSWATDQSATAITISYRQASSGTWTDVALSSGNTSGSVEQTLSSEFSADKSYEIKVTVADSSGSSDVSRVLSSGKFLIDFKTGGDGIAIGKAAENVGFEVHMDTKFEKSVTTCGEVEIYGSPPHLDFHFANSTSDYTSRIIEESSGKVNVLAPNGLFNNGEQVALQSDFATSDIVLSVNNNRLKNFSYTAKYVPAISAVFVRIYGTINADMNTGYDYDVINIGGHGPSAQTALAVKSGKNVSASAKNSNVISVRPLEAGIINYDVYIAGFWFV